MRPTKLQIESGIRSTGKYRQENGYSMTEHQAYVDGWYDAIDFCQDNESQPEPEKSAEEIDRAWLWYAKQIHKSIEEFDDYDRHVCRVLFEYTQSGEVKNEINDDEIEKQFPLKETSPHASMEDHYVNNWHNWLFVSKREGAKWYKSELKKR